MQGVLGMAGQVLKRNAIVKKALGIREIEFRFYRSNRSHWSVEMVDGVSFNLALPNLATESSVIRGAARKLAEMGRSVRWPEF